MNSALPRWKVFLFYAMTILIVIAIVETLSFGLYLRRKRTFDFYQSHSLTVREDIIIKLEGLYDATLGWKNIYNTKFGERPREMVYTNDLLTSFGDSFTFSSDVADDETWQAYLSGLTKANVYNMGVPGFGTDQAYLRFTSEYPMMKTKLVTLGLIVENINRIVNVYKRYYLPSTNRALTKPRYIFDKQSIKLIPNPITRRKDLVKLKNIEFIKTLGQNDYWYRDNYFFHVKSFPYTRILFSRHFRNEIVFRLRNNLVNMYSSLLWEDAEAPVIMFKIFDKFVDEAKALGGTPIIMLFPLKDDLEYNLKYGVNTTGHQKILNYCQRMDYWCFDGISILASEAKTVYRIDKYVTKHLSPFGNKLIAKHFLKYLTSNHLLSNN